jgi:phosphatidylglycerophosphate synthase
MRRWHGPQASRRFAAAAAVVLFIQQRFTTAVLRSRGARGLQPVDVLTLSRGLAAALLAGVAAARVDDRRGSTGWISWLALVYGAILCDWLDGPIARRVGTSEAGTVLDLESDSWLTLWSAIAAVTWGGLPSYVVVPTIARYGFLLAALSRLSYAEANDHPPLERQIGIAQMTLFLAALAPFGGRLTRPVLRPAAALIAPLRLVTMAALYGRRLGMLPSKPLAQRTGDGEGDATRE